MPRPVTLSAKQLKNPLRCGEPPHDDPRMSDPNRQSEVSAGVRN